MSKVSKRADLTLLMADFINHAENNKFNIIGGGITILQPGGSDVTFCVLAMVEIPEEMCPVEATIEVALLGQDNEVIPLPGMDDRITKVVTFGKPSVGAAIAAPGVGTVITLSSTSAPGCLSNPGLSNGPYV
jgi:hypothetical protein